jgi:hypothetical protein
MTNRLHVLLLATAAVGFCCGCTTQPTGLPGAYYKIPVYQPSTVEDSMGGHYSDSIGGAATAESLSWFLKTSDSPTKVVTFYQANLPVGSRATDEELAEESDGSEDDKLIAKFKYQPAGAEEDEDVTVRISEKRFQITELLKPGKRKD